MLVVNDLSEGVLIVIAIKGFDSIPCKMYTGSGENSRPWRTAGKRRPDISSKQISDDLPIYIISSAAEVLGLHQRTLYMYEGKGLIVPVRKGNRRFYSASDLEWIRTIRYLIHERGINLEGLRQLLAIKAQLSYRGGYQESCPECEGFVRPTAPCWQEGRTQFDCHTCPVYGAAIRSLCEDQGVPLLAT